MAGNTSDVIVIGGGVSGTALLFMLARYTGLSKLTLLEKYETTATLNSNARANSQTLHVGDIETNYTLEKAQRVNKLASMVRHYGGLVDDGQHFLTAYQKMVLAVGDEEVEKLTQRHHEFSEAFPYMELWDKKTIHRHEPDVVAMGNGERAENIIASACQDRISAVNFGDLSASFLKQAQQTKPQTQAHFNTQAKKIVEKDGEYEVHTKNGVYHARAVAVCAGAHSLLLAHGMGHGLDFALLPVAGSFFYVPREFRGKVYTIQNNKLPFAAIHADPDVIRSGVTRLGPTALVLPKLERYKGGTYLDFMKVSRFDRHVVKTFLQLIKDRDIRNYIFRNMLYDIPLIRERFFVDEARKIIPSLTAKELEFAHGVGGVRPQIINRKEEKLVLGEATINPGKGVMFNVTPSPGASTCLGMAYDNTKEIVSHLGCEFDQTRLIDELLEGEEP